MSHNININSVFFLFFFKSKHWLLTVCFFVHYDCQYIYIYIWSILNKKNKKNINSVLSSVNLHFTFWHLLSLYSMIWILKTQNVHPLVKPTICFATCYNHAETIITNCSTLSELHTDKLFCEEINMRTHKPLNYYRFGCESDVSTLSFTFSSILFFRSFCHLYTKSFGVWRCVLRWHL